MESMKVEGEQILIDFLLEAGGFANRTRVRKLIKYGQVQVDGQVIKVPATIVSEGNTVSWESLKGASDVGKSSGPTHDFTLGVGEKEKKAREVKAPFEIIHEDAFLLAYIKPAGMVFASPNPKVKTAYNEMRNWMKTMRPECTDLHFVNRVEKESSGILVIAKDLKWRTHLQDNWNDYSQGLYVLIAGHLPPDDVITAIEYEDGKRGPVQEFKYRTMRATERHTLLKFETGLHQIPLLMSGLRRHECLIVGKGKEAPDPLDGRSGMHLFRVNIVGPEGEQLSLKTRVPKEFLNIMQGGISPKAEPLAMRKAKTEEKKKPGARKPGSYKLKRQ
jgi:23S rRNA-/tRNA-specific pseudouridylate synthase